MARLVVDNVGPIQHADVEVKKLTVFIGPQSSGKSTIAKVFSFCCWLDKMTDDTHKALATGAYKRLESYHRMTGYLREDSRIRFVGENIIYEYNWVNETTTPDAPYNIFPCGDDKERCYEITDRATSPKVEYIPAERNFVSAVHNLGDYVEEDDNLQDFVNTWYKSKKIYTKEQSMDVLGLDMKYYYDESSLEDYIRLSNGERILLSSASSGVQSIVPLLGLVWQFTTGIYHNQAERPFSPAESDKIRELLGRQKKVEAYGEDLNAMMERVLGFAKGKIYTHTQLILEEPEQNLFPDTQCRLINFLLGSINHGKDHRLLLTTHSPYILNYLNVLLQRDRDSDVYFVGDNLSVYRINEGITSNLLGKDDYGTYLIDTIDLNETMQFIYKEFVALRKK